MKRLAGVFECRIPSFPCRGNKDKQDLVPLRINTVDSVPFAGNCMGKYSELSSYNKTATYPPGLAGYLIVTNISYIYSTLKSVAESCEVSEGYYETFY